MSEAAVVIRFGVIVVEFDRFREISNGGVVVAVVELRHSSLVVGLLGVLRISFYGLREIGDSSSVIAPGAMCYGAPPISFNVLRVKLNRLRIVLNCCIKTSLSV